MLVVQRPRMGSSQPPDPNLPFGYAFDSNQELFPDPPPQPARGEPLLTDNDAKSLGSFFDFMSGDPYNNTSFGEGLNFGSDISWFDMPPQFVGSTTSFGQASMSPTQLGLSQSHEFGDVLSVGSGLMPPPPPPPPPAPQASQSSLEQQQQQPQPQPQPQHQQQHQQQHATADVLAAATLLRNGSVGRSNDGGQREVPRTLGVPVGHLRHQGLDDFRQEGHKTLQQGPLPNEHDAHFTEMFFGSRSRPSMSRQAHVGDVQWGSDSAFNQGQAGYVPRSDKDTYEAISQKQIDLIQCLEVSQSAGNTRPPSPVTEESSPVKTHSRKTSELGDLADDADGPPRKRWKSRVKNELDEDDETSSPAPRSGRRRKPKSTESPVFNGMAAEKGSGASKRRKSTNGAKPGRENLTEEQKRENHIRSEQKRRTLIKEGFDDLVSIVPNLRGGGFSKSSMLTGAAEWLEELLDYNGQLAAHLAGLKSR